MSNAKGFLPKSPWTYVLAIILTGALSHPIAQVVPAGPIKVACGIILILWTLWLVWKFWRQSQSE